MLCEEEEIWIHLVAAPSRFEFPDVTGMVRDMRRPYLMVDDPWETVRKVGKASTNMDWQKIPILNPTRERKSRMRRMERIR